MENRGDGIEEALGILAGAGADDGLLDGLRRALEPPEAPEPERCPCCGEMAVLEAPFRETVMFAGRPVHYDARMLHCFNPYCAEPDRFTCEQAHELDRQRVLQFAVEAINDALKWADDADELARMAADLAQAICEEAEFARLGVRDAGKRAGSGD